MDYRVMLKYSKKPYYTLAQAFAEVTGIGISVRVIQRLRKEYSDNLILDAILVMRGKKLDNPLPYFFTVCKNKQQDLGQKLEKNSTFEPTFDLFRAEKNRERPVLRSPWDEQRVTV